MTTDKPEIDTKGIDFGATEARILAHAQEVELVARDHHVVESKKAPAKTADVVAEVMKKIASGHFHVNQLGDLIMAPRFKVRRKPHKWLHPTKGWRMFARPRGTNKRRKLIPAGACQVRGSHEYNRLGYGR